MSDYRIRLLLVVIKEGNSDETVYFDAFSDMDIERAIVNEYFKVIALLDIPFTEYHTVIEEFESRFQDCIKVKKQKSAFQKKEGYSLSFQKYFEVMEWIEFKNKKYNLKKVK